jgi:hypothetical protein
LSGRSSIGVSPAAWSTPPVIVHTASSRRPTVRLRVGQVAWLVDDAEDRDVGRAADAQAPEVRPADDRRRGDGGGLDDLGKGQPERKEPRHRRREIDDGSFDRVAMEIRADRVGDDPLRQRLVGGLPREASAAVPDVEADAPLRRPMGLGHDASITTAYPGSGRGEGMGEDVAGSHPLEGRPDVCAVGDVGHQRDTGKGRHLEGGVERRFYVRAARFGPEAHLDPNDDVAMVGDDRRRLARPGETHVVQLPDERRDEACGRDVEERQDVDRCRFDRVPTKCREVREAGRPRIDRGRDAAGEVDDRIDPVGACVRPVAMEVDQAGSHHQPRHVDHAVVGFRDDTVRWRDRRDPPLLGDKVTSVVDAGRRVDQPSTGEDGPRHSRDRTHHQGAA